MIDIIIRMRFAVTSLVKICLVFSFLGQPCNIWIRTDGNF